MNVPAAAAAVCSVPSPSAGGSIHLKISETILITSGGSAALEKGESICEREREEGELEREREGESEEKQ